MKADAEVIRNAFEAGYAPREWKGKYAGWNLDLEINKIKAKIDQLSPPTVKSYQQLLLEFFNSMKDYHVGIYFHATERATLPFQVKGANGKYFITYIDTERLSPHVFPVNIGDELVNFGGQPVEKVVQEIVRAYLKGSNEETDRAYAEYFLTLRAAAIGHKVPKGPITIGIRPLGASKTATYQLIWNYTPEKISNGFLGSWKPEAKVLTSLVDHPLFKIKMADPLYEALYAKEENENASPNMLFGERESFVPTLGRIWWQSEASSPFHAYLYEGENRKLIGYVRIPHYWGSGEEAAQFAEIIRYFEERSDALIIDQVDNPGGVLPYCYSLASMLTDTPLSTPLHRLAITQEDVAHAVYAIPILEIISSDSQAQQIIGEDFYGLPVTYQMTRFLLDFCNFVLEEWKVGRQLTSPYFLYNINHINPHPAARYTKPILVLINSLDISCGDFFPAILQDNKRATLFGTRTAGAGGYVREASYPNLFGIDAFRYTGSIAERVDQNPIENIGVTPDIAYTITEADLQGNFAGYAEAVNKAVNALLK